MPNLRAALGWAVVDPTSGNGNAQISVSTAAPYTGRVLRSQTIQVTATGVATPQNVVVQQKAKSEFVEIQATGSVAKTGGTLTVTGTSNSSKLTFSLTPGAAPLTLTLPGTYTAGGASTANGAAIAGDPGASAQYDFSIVFSNIPANATIGSLTNTLKVAAAGGSQDTCVITQSAGDPTLSVSANEITLEASGAAQTFNVISNAAWTIRATV